MMKKNIHVFLQTFLAVFLASYGTVFCLISAYGFNPDRSLLLMWIVMLSVLLGAAAVLKHRKLVFPVLLVIFLAPLTVKEILPYSAVRTVMMTSCSR